MLSGILRLNRVDVSVSAGRTPLRAGTSDTSSKVSASGISDKSIIQPRRICAAQARMEEEGLSGNYHIWVLPDY
jgi:hypothetical protein